MYVEKRVQYNLRTRLLNEFNVNIEFVKNLYVEKTSSVQFKNLFVKNTSSM